MSVIRMYDYPTVFCVTIRNRDLCVDSRYLTVDCVKFSARDAKPRRDPRCVPLNKPSQ